MKRPKTPSLVTIVILTTITVVFWVLFSVYRAFTTEPSPTVPPEIIEPLSPNLDGDALSKVEGRTFFADDQIPTITILTPTPTGLPSGELETLIATPTATPTATSSPTPTATPSGEAIP